MNTQTTDRIQARTTAVSAPAFQATTPSVKRAVPVPQAEDAVAAEVEDERRTDATSPESNLTQEQPAPASDVAAGDAAATEDKSEQPSCRQIHSDGTEEECHQSAVWPWMIAGSGVLLAGAAGAGGHGNDRPVTVVAPVPVTPVPVTPGAPIPPPEAALPAAPRLSTSSGKDTIDRTGHVDVALASPGASWVYRIDGDKTWHAGQGSSLDAGTLDRGVHAVMVAQVDGQGRRGDVATLAVRVHDEVLAPTLTLAHDNGASTNDGLTNDGTIAVSVLLPDATWFYRVNGAADWVQGQGDQVPAGALVAGQNKIEAYQVDASGEHGPLTSLAVTLDLTPPDAPLLQTSNGTDLLNAKDFINVSGIEGGASWKFRVNGQGDWIDGHDGRIPATALSNGDNQVDVVQVDVAGNAGATATLSIRQDLDAPDPLQAHLEGGHGELVPLQGAVVLDNIEPGATWKYRVNDEIDWHVGTGSQLPASNLIEGSNDVALMQTDSAGHDGAVTSIFVIRDSLAPDRPELVTSNGLPVINGHGSLLVDRLEDGATWQYRIDGGDWKAGTGSELAASLLHEGNQTVDVRQSDLAGNVSAVDTLAVTLDATAPDVFMASVHKQNGTEAPDNLINATGYVSIDNLETGASWEFKLNGDDHWRKGSGTQLSTRFFDEGTNALEVRQIDAAGNPGTASTVQLTLDTTAPTIEVTGRDAPFASDSLLQLNGRSSVTVATHGSDIGSMTYAGVTYDLGANGRANWAADHFSFGQQSNVPVQSTLLVTASDKAGNTSTRVLTLRVDTIAPNAPAVKLKNDTGADHSDRITSDGTVLVSGLQAEEYVHYSLDNGQHWSAWQSGGEIPGSVFGADGVKNLLVQVSDSYLNISPTSSLQFTLNSAVI